jgi:hypothetical protein
MGGGDEDGRAEYRDEIYHDLQHSVMELMVNVGLFNTVADAWPNEVQEQWVMKIQAQIEWAQSEIAEVQSFAEHFDE